MRAYKWIVCVVLVIAIGAGVFYFGDFRSDESTLEQTQAASETATEQDVTEFTFSAEDYCADLLQILNAYRAKNNLSAWTSDEALSAAASTRAYECSILQSKSHTRTDGSEWYSVLGIAENYNYLEITGKDSQAASEMARTWIAGASANASLLSAEYTACGLGCEAIGSDVYAVLILYKP